MRAPSYFAYFAAHGKKLQDVIVLSPTKSDTSRALRVDNKQLRQQGQHSFLPLRPVRSLRHMTTQLLTEAAQVIPNQQLLINVVSKRVRQLGLGHRPLVETTPRMSLTDIALKEIIAGKLAYESLEGSSDGA